MKFYKKLFPILSFLVPLFFLPLTPEYYDSAKTILLSVFTLLLFGLWVWRSLKSGKLMIQKHYFLAPLAVFFAAILISFLFSQDKVLSLYGYYGRLINSLPFYAILFLLFIGIVNVLKSEKNLKNIIIGLILGIDLLGVWVILHHFKVLSAVYPQGWDFLKIHNFNMIGTSALMPYICILNIALSSYLFSNLKNRLTAAVGIFSLAISVFVFTFTSGDPLTGGNWLVYLSLLISLAIVILFNSSLIKQRKIYSVSFLVILILSVIAVNVNPFKKSLRLDTNPYPRESVLGFNLGWKIMSGTLSVSPEKALFGSGPDTFIEGFAKYKPIEYNSTNFWEIRFSRSGGEFIEILSNLGVTTFAAFLALFFTILKIAWKNVRLDLDERPLIYESRALMSVFFTIIIAGIFANFNSLIWFILIVSLAGIAILERLGEKKETESELSLQFLNNVFAKDLMPKIFSIGFIIFSLASIFFFTKSFGCDYYYRKSLLKSASNDIESANTLAIRSSEWLSKKDYPHRQIALQSLLILEKISSEEEPDIENQKIFLNQVLNETERMLELAPNNVENWEAASLIYQRLANLTDGQYFEHAVEALNISAALDPFKPQTYESLGILFARAKNFEMAIQNLDYAIRLQPRFFRLYMSLAQVYELQGDIENAVNVLEYAKSLVSENSEIINAIDEKIQDLTKGTKDADDEADLD